MSTTPETTHVCFVHASSDGKTWSIKEEKQIKVTEIGDLAVKTLDAGSQGPLESR
jgi:hypothetical protein